MHKKICVMLLVIIHTGIFTYAQTTKNTGEVKGKLFNKITKEPSNDIKISIPDIKLFTTTDGEGNFILSEVPYGRRKIIISSYNIRTDSMVIVVNKPVVDLGDIAITPSETGASPESVEIPTIAIEENNLSADDDNTAQNVNGLLVANKDPFVYTAAYIFGYYHFQPRGYQRNQQEVQVNGIEVNDIETGNATWNQFGGLNDVFHSRNVTYGLTPSEYAFGGLNGSVYLDATAADQRKGTSITYTNTDRNYRNRIMLTGNSGLMKNGWAYSVSISKRWAQEGYVPGTFYDGYSYYAAVSKVIRKHHFNLTAFGAPTRRGKASTATQETFDLAGTNQYNDDWGYQNGVKRNARVENVFQPVFILNYEYKPSDRTRWNTALGYQFGKDKNSFIDYYNASVPRPDYYRYLPSYYLNIVPPEPSAAASVRAQIMSNPQLLQIDWNRLYNTNYTNIETVNDVNGIAGNNITGRRSLYALSNNVDDIKKWTFNSTYEHSINQHATFYGGVNLVSQQTESYLQMADLLGGDFFVNYNQFAARQYVGNGQFYQNNLNDPNQIIKVGDKYGFDYITRFNDGWLWGQAAFTYNRFDFFIAANAGVNSFSREGLMRNGLFPDNSYGTSATQAFFTYGVKGGFTYKFDARNSLFINAAYTATPPTTDNTYISARTRDFTVNNPTTQINQSVEGGYLLKSSIVNARAVGYATDVKDATIIKRFYNDDPAYQTFVNYVMQNVNTRFIGTELALDVKVLPSLNINGVASLAQAFYSNRPNVSVYLDNDTSRMATTRQVYIKNYYLAVGPQSVYTIGFNYHPSRSWYADINFNYLDRNYVDINPDRHTPQAADLIQPNSQQWHEIFDQEKLPAAFTSDLRVGKTFQLSRMSKSVNKLSRNTVLSISLGINNLFNNRNLIIRGYEQLRYDFTNNNPSKFPNTYEYGYGINYFANINLRF